MIAQGSALGEMRANGYKPTQGFALGFPMSPLWGFSNKMRLP